jgi:hypothetical protein
MMENFGKLMENHEKTIKNLLVPLSRSLFGIWELIGCPPADCVRCLSLLSNLKFGIWEVFVPPRSFDGEDFAAQFVHVFLAHTPLEHTARQLAHLKTIRI